MPLIGPLPIMSVPSSSSSSSSASHPRKSRYDIVLSFAAGTHKNFTDDLYSALERERIHTFRDDEGGEDSASELLGTSIKGSWGSIIIISEEYVFSGRCLDELVEIMNHREKWGRVYPIFYYNVDPSDLTHQRNNIEEAFEQHEMRYNRAKTQTWRLALKQVAEIRSRWAFRDYADE
ncbi:hypothetical protein COLO4_27943 [Corchorus olitorius]|uniref:TIR domain-containing protein n=1 Tax=Corchorus olitorius TaxID=93759 RepID=A0A1R3HNI6_9ROSI|nr:hypothetical protein COLO4_27943 [Corchorus olitorius]